jgi:hypothetical protein
MIGTRWRTSRLCFREVTIGAAPFGSIAERWSQLVARARSR